MQMSDTAMVFILIQKAAKTHTQQETWTQYNIPIIMKELFDCVQFKKVKWPDFGKHSTEKVRGT